MKYRVTLVVEAESAAAATVPFLVDESSDYVDRILEVKVETATPSGTFATGGFIKGGAPSVIGSY